MTDVIFNMGSIFFPIGMCHMVDVRFNLHTDSHHSRVLRQDMVDGRSRRSCFVNGRHLQLV